MKRKLDQDPELLFKKKQKLNNEHSNIATQPVIPTDMMLAIAENIPSIKDVSRFFSIFKSPFLQTSLQVKSALTYVVEGDVTSLSKRIEEDPSLLFIKDQITAPRGQRYFNVSPYQLMIFLCDDDMKVQIMALETVVEYLNDLGHQEIRKQQYEEIACGGEDLIKLNRDPKTILADHGFKGLIHYQTTYTFYDTSQHTVAFPLLQNSDGIICYQDEKGKQHFYYVNQEKEILKPLSIGLISEEHTVEFDQFVASFDAMESNSSRRSSAKEHQLIQQILGCDLVQKGVWYKHHEVLYKDNRTPFNLVNVLRKCVRLYQEGKLDEGDICWRHEVRCAQGEEIWLLQKLCEENRSFYPLNKEHVGFKRGFMVEKNEPYEELSVLEKGVINISDFALYKTEGRGLFAAGAQGATSARWSGLGPCIDLVALCWLIEKAKENVIECKSEQNANELYLGLSQD